ncbi:tetratricopeptide repeat protein, partial [Streptomyces albus]|uniref:tetratricopeptide repeat protein n=1 Tax=Streptomyces albus TaxID=1888 RepID=UPI0034525C44
MKKRDKASMATSGEGSALADLDQAIDLARRAVAAAPPGHPARAALLNNLGSALRARFERTGDFSHLDEAIELARQALAAIPVDDARYPTILANLGAVLSEVGRREEALVIAEEAVAIRRRLAAENPAAHEPSLASALNNLGA